MKKNSGIILLALWCSTLFISCSKSKSENVEFSVSPADMVFTLDSLQDSINGVDTFYMASANLNLDFFRNACDAENVYLDDVESVSLTKADLSIPATSLTNFKAFKKINLEATSSSYSPVQLANVNPLSGSDTVAVSLPPLSTNLYDYFRLHDFNFRFVIGKKTTTAINPMSMTFKPQFKVKGVDH